MLEKPTTAEIQQDQEIERQDIEAAENTHWERSSELALDEARRLIDSEEDRRRTVENKASTYLLFAAGFSAAFIPILPDILERKTGSAPQCLIDLIIIFSISYLLTSGLWAFRALKVGIYHRLDVFELSQLWKHSQPNIQLIRETFKIGRSNYAAINEKVSCLKMAQEFLVRSFVAFGILVLIETTWAGGEIFFLKTGEADSHRANSFVSERISLGYPVAIGNPITEPNRGFAISASDRDENVSTSGARHTTLSTTLSNVSN